MNRAEQTRTGVEPSVGAGGESSVGELRPRPQRGALRPIEFATAAVLGGVTAVFAVIAWVLPHASALQALGSVPMGVVAYRTRPRALIASAVAAIAVSFLAAGTGPVYGVVASTLVGGLVGDVKRRGRSWPTLAAASIVVVPAGALVTDGMLVVFTKARQLTLEQIRSVTHGIAGMVALVPFLRGSAKSVDHFVAHSVRDWALTVAVVVGVELALAIWVAWELIGPVLERLDQVPPEDRLESAPNPNGAAPSPLPVTLSDVSLRYPGSSSDALRGVDLHLDELEFAALVGANGSGKSTLARVLAGRSPTGGDVKRAGPAGLGLPGGTALVSQRPESQILGVLVADDVVWGLPPHVSIDVEDLLDVVGLSGMGQRETTGLSGGEMQRLAVAAALARHPRLLLSDESTAMVDRSGRVELMRLLRSLPSRYPMTVVHVTHQGDEAAGADRVLHMAAGRIVAPESTISENWFGCQAGEDPEDQTEEGENSTSTSRRSPIALPSPGATPILRLRNVDFTYEPGTPWAHEALVGIDLDVAEGEGLLVVGGNGSGKTTLGWIMAGLLSPTAGTCDLDGSPMSEQVGAVGLAFQHARLQLQRPTVGADIRAASGIKADQVGAALSRVGLEESLADRPIDQLSGGQMRRVALAGLLAHQPRVVILDEPMAGLDPPSRRALLEVLADLRRDSKLTLIVISHDLEGLDRVCGRTVELVKGRLSTEADGLAGEQPAVSGVSQ